MSSVSTASLVSPCLKNSPKMEYLGVLLLAGAVFLQGQVRRRFTGREQPQKCARLCAESCLWSPTRVQRGPSTKGMTTSVGQALAAYLDEDVVEQIIVQRHAEALPVWPCRRSQRRDSRRAGAGPQPQAQRAARPRATRRKRFSETGRKVRIRAEPVGLVLDDPQACGGLALQQVLLKWPPHVGLIAGDSNRQDFLAGPMESLDDLASELVEGRMRLRGDEDAAARIGAKDRRDNDRRDQRFPVPGGPCSAKNGCTRSMCGTIVDAWLAGSRSAASSAHSRRNVTAARG